VVDRPCALCGLLRRLLLAFCRGGGGFLGGLLVGEMLGGGFGGYGGWSEPGVGADPGWDQTGADTGWDQTGADFGGGDF
jgi:hypothetical protein